MLCPGYLDLGRDDHAAFLLSEQAPGNTFYHALLASEVKGMEASGHRSMMRS